MGSKKSKPVSVSRLSKGFPGQTVSVCLGAEPQGQLDMPRAALHPCHAGRSLDVCTGLHSKDVQRAEVALGMPRIHTGYGQDPVCPQPGELLWEAGIQEMGVSLSGVIKQWPLHWK